MLDRSGIRRHAIRAQIRAALVIVLALCFWQSTAHAEATLNQLCDGDTDVTQWGKFSNGYIPAEAVTNALPAEGDARILYKRRLNSANPQRFRIFEPERVAQPSVISTETPATAVNNDYPVNESVILHVSIPRQANWFPLWHRRDFRIVECDGNQFKSWAFVQAYVSSPVVAYFWIPVSVAVFMLSIVAVHRSRKTLLKNTETEGKLAEKYPSVFAAKQFESIDFFNPIQLTANAFNQGSVQKFQVLMFSFIVGSLVLSLVLRTGALTDLSVTVVGLLGISGIGAAVSQITYTSKTRLSFDNWAWLQSNEVIRNQRARGPEWKDLVLTNREFDVYKLQTIVFSLAVAVALILDGASHLASFEIPSTMLQVLGLSQVVFVGGILVRPPATEDLDKALDKLREAAHNYTEALARGTDVDANGKLLDQKPAGSEVAENARRQYLQLVASTIPMIESTLEIEVDDAALRDAPLSEDVKKLKKNAKKMAARGAAGSDGNAKPPESFFRNLGRFWIQAFTQKTTVNEQNMVSCLVALAQNATSAKKGAPLTEAEAGSLIDEVVKQFGLVVTADIKAQAVSRLGQNEAPAARAWSAANEADATHDGWRIVDDAGTAHIRLIAGGTSAFKSDQDLVNHIRQLAERGDPLATRAVRYLQSINSPDVSGWSIGGKTGEALWLPENEADAEMHGWKIFEDGGTQRIGRTDGPTAFATDADAANHVKQCAQGRDGLALRAIAYLKRVNSPDVGQYGLDKLG